jgi:hypothetical protein
MVIGEARDVNRAKAAIFIEIPHDAVIITA